MKLILLLTIALGIQMKASVYSQTTLLSLNVKDIPIREVLNELEGSSKFKFFYNEDFINVDERVSLKVSDNRVDEILEKMLVETNIDYRILENNMIVLTKKQEKQQITLKGKVTDIDGNSLPGVNVVEKGTGNGTVTNLDGEYIISVSSEEAVLSFSYVGYLTEEVMVSGKTEINMILVEDILALDEVVVVGYGLQKKINVSGSISTVSSEQLEERPVTSVAEALQGVVPNLQISTTDGGRPGSTLTWQLRGQGSIGDVNDSPLILIDGIPGDPNILNPEDIENISVLKDAAAASIYGSRAPYGVVLITTKKGTSEKMKVTLSSNTSMRQPTNMLDMMGSVDFVNYYNESAANLGVAPYIPQAHVDAIIQNASLPEDQRLSYLPHETDPTRWGLPIAIDTDWWGETYKNSALTQDYNITASGGSKAVVYYASLGYLDQEGLYRYGDDSYKRYSGLLNLNMEATKWLDLSYKTRMTRAENDEPNSPETQLGAQRSWPIWPVFDNNGNWTSSSRALHIHAEGGRLNTLRDNFNNTLGFVIKPFNKFKINGDVTFNSYAEKFRGNMKKLYRYTPSGEEAGLQNSANKSYIEKKYSINNYYSANIYADYAIQVNDHYFHALAGFQQEKNHYYRLEGYRDGLISEDILSLNSSTGTDLRTSDGESEWVSRGYFARINYNYKEKYILEVNGRYDGSSKFPSDLRWGFFPSASLAYNIANETYFKPIAHIFSMMKFRLSYGQLGNSNIKSNYYSPSMSKKQTTYLGPSGVFLDYITAPGFGNYNLTWEKPTTFNVGLDTRAFDNRLQMNFDWYRRITTDMIGPSSPLPAVLGAPVPVTNNTELKGTGWELTLMYRNAIEDFHYQVNLNVSHHKEEVTKYYNPKGLFTEYYEGMQLGEIWGFETVGIIQDEVTLNSMPDQTQIYPNWGLGDIQYKDQNGDGEITRGAKTLSDPGDYVIIGNTTPDYAYNISLSCDYKGFDMRVFFTGIGHTDWWPSTGQGDYQQRTEYLFFGNGSNMWLNTSLNDHLDSWRPDNTDAYYPRALVGNGNPGARNREIQTRYLQNRAYLRMKNIQFGYSFSEKWMKPLFIQGARIYVSGENLLTFTNLRIFNPETPGMIYPLQKVYSAGIKVTF